MLLIYRVVIRDPLKLTVPFKGSLKGALFRRSLSSGSGFVDYGVYRGLGVRASGV